jgi:hypothetical protein
MPLNENNYIADCLLNGREVMPGSETRQSVQADPFGA